MRRSWLFVPGADQAARAAAARSGADVIVLELEDTPSRTELAKARRIVLAFERARAAGKERAKVAGALIEVPIYAAAKRLLASAARS